jgi:hypothetical protein
MPNDKEEPFEMDCSNPGFDDKWTCPGCYKDLGNVGHGNEITCEDCGCVVKCSLYMQPVCLSEVTNYTD